MFAGRQGAAVIAGASGGIGQQISQLFIEQHSAVALGYHQNGSRLDPLLALAESVGVGAEPFQVDLTDAVATAEAIASVSASQGGIHTLVYAAGPHVPQLHLSRVSAGDFAEQIRVHITSFFNFVGTALPHLRSSGGSVVAVTSAGTDRYPVRDGLSTTPSAAIEALARALAVEEGRYGVRVNCVGPGMLTDGMSARLMASGDLDEKALAAARKNIPLGRFGVARDVAEAVCFLASERAGFISGQKLNIDGGYSA
jgi:3-oxoacyl-[acyl-carrier protein] reductase